MLKVLSVLAALIVAVPIAAAQSAELPAGTYIMDRAHASLTWKVRHFGLSNYTARFTKLDATLEIDPARPESAKLAVMIDPASVRTDYASAVGNGTDFDRQLIDDPKFFDAGKFGAITFNSTKIERTGETTATITGDLTLLGVTKPVTIEVTLNAAKEHPVAKKPALGFSGVGTIKRSEYGMTHLIPLIGDDVTILIEAEFLKS